MPRRIEVVPVTEPPKKKCKVVEEAPPSLEVSFFDDEALPPGIVFTDVQLKKWRIGKPIGRGSFGRIYLASDSVDKEVTKQNARYVVKIEPHTNGPLFVEIHCLIRTAQVSKVNAWRQQKKLKHVGMPVYIASGSFTDESSGVKYRFLILPRYDIDLQKVIARTRVLDLKNVCILAIQILDVLEYLHSQGYTHSDIKSSNLMLGFDGNNIAKFSMPKPAPSFEKETKEVSVLAGKQRKAKTSKSRGSNYYDDEDFIIKDYKSGFNCSPDSEKDKKLAQVKNKLRKILSDRDSRTLHRHHAFNLRQISNYVNYEDMTSSVCSDQSYQRLLDDFGNKRLGQTKEGYNVVIENPETVFKEAILSQSAGQIYLCDYGLASKFLDAKGDHKEFGMDARKAHDGTLEYSSRDSHIGAHSRRSDLETLGYNLLDWLTGTLPWKTAEVLAEPDLVHALKKNFMSDVKSLLKTCFKTEFYPQFIEKFLQYVTSLDYTEKPDYNYCRNLFRTELVKNGCVDKELSLNFGEPKSPMRNKKLCYSKRFARKNTPADFIARNGVKKTFERENICSLENDLKLELLKQTLNSSSDGVRKPCTLRNFFISDADLVARLKKSLMPHDVLGKKLSPKNLRSNAKQIKKRRGKRTHRSSIGKFGNFMGSARQFTWAEILAGNPEDLLRKGNSSSDDEDTCKYRIRKLSNASENSMDNVQSPLSHKDYLQDLNPTYAMKEVVANFKKRATGKPVKDAEEIEEGFEGYTPIMIKMYKIKEKREAKEKALAAKEKALAAKEKLALAAKEKALAAKEKLALAAKEKSAAKTVEKKEAKDKTVAKAVKNTEIVNTRCTRSKNAAQVTTRSVKVTDEAKTGPKQDVDSKIKTRKVSPKKSNTKSSKKEVKVVIEPAKVPEKVTNTTKSTRSRETVIPTSSRRLRSSRQTK